MLLFSAQDLVQCFDGKDIQLIYVDIILNAAFTVKNAVKKRFEDGIQNT